MKKGPKANVKMILVLVMVVVLAVSCSKSNDSPSATVTSSDEFSKKYNAWSMGTTYATGSPVVESMQYFADLVNEKSNGAMTINVFPDSTLGNEDDTFLSVCSGDTEFCCFGPSTIYLFTPEYSFIMAPFLTQSYEHYVNMYNSKLFDPAKKIWREKGVIDLATQAYRGFRNMSSDRAVRTPEDVQGMKLRMNTNAAWVRIWNGVGCTTIPIALGELYTSLQTGVVEASEGPYEQIATYKLQEVQKYIIETQHVPEVFGFWMNGNLFDSLPENYQRVLKEAAAEGIEYGTKLCQSVESDFLKQLTDAGCEFIKPDKEAFVEKAKPVWEEMFKDTWTGTTMEEVLSYAK
ncbi:TRAP transporter substrate-binding protein [Marispirochaeta sp.]|jgi:TRAP-type transport system periplasmic protein|uniref:TRAP transporter substrate-binding protein n=1 Tax=Marispirochaeta sp. TaxID=2038653 RepID=UPI0029C7546D|nr:TRAP transporter substrate-binding protein [Marispirochaeta sp.]